MDTRPIVAISMGDPSGIGAEIAVKALSQADIYLGSKPLLVGDIDCVMDAASMTATNIAVNVVDRPDQGEYRPGTIDVIDLDNIAPGEIAYGRVSGKAGKAAFQYVERCIKLALAGEVDAVATGPISKEALNLGGHHYSGHAEIFADFTDTKDYCMMLVDGNFRVSYVTTHAPLRDACVFVTGERVAVVIGLTHNALVRLGISQPKIGVGGLSPRAGEGGVFGTEETEAIEPAVREAWAQGINAEGPISPDILSAKALAGQYDAAVAMYHDQWHIPMKAFSSKLDASTGRRVGMSGVNITLGLPIIQTSVDDGTGFAKMDRGKANPMSMIQAIELATLLARGGQSPNLPFANHGGAGVEEAGHTPQ